MGRTPEEIKNMVGGKLMTVEPLPESVQLKIQQIMIKNKHMLEDGELYMKTDNRRIK